MLIADVDAVVAFTAVKTTTSNAANGGGSKPITQSVDTICKLVILERKKIFNDIDALGDKIPSTPISFDEVEKGMHNHNVV